MAGEDKGGAAVINHHVIAALISSHAALLGLYGWTELRVSRAQTELASLERAHEQQAKAAAEMILLLQSEAVERERNAAQIIADLAEQYRQEQQDAQKKTDTTLADLRSGNLRLRQRLAAARCPSLPGAVSGADGSDGSDGTGLQRSDAEFLVRFADRADTAVRRLTLCQATVKQYTQLTSSPP